MLIFFLQTFMNISPQKIRQHLLSLAILCILSTSTLQASHAASGEIFTDVGTDHPYSVAITTLKGLGVIGGFPDGSFQPDLYVNRAEALKMIMESSIKEIPDTVQSGFPDVKASDWFAKYVALGKDRNIIAGYPDGTFRGNELINFGEILKITFRTFGLVASSTYSEAQLRVNFPKYTGKEWFLPYMMYAKEKNMLILTEPGAYPTRAQIAELLYRIIVIQKYNLGSFEEKNIPLYTTLGNAIEQENTILSSSLESLESSPLLSGKQANLVMPFILIRDPLLAKEDTLGLINNLINETDVIHTLLNNKVAIAGIAPGDYQTRIVAIKNELASLKNQLVNATGTMSDEETKAFLFGLLQARKDIVKLYASLELSAAKSFVSQKILLQTLSAYSDAPEYQQMTAQYKLAEDALDLAESSISSITAKTDEFVAFKDAVSGLDSFKKNAEEIHRLAGLVLKRVNK